MATIFNRYDGPSIDLAMVRVYIKHLTERDDHGPTEDEIVKAIRKRYYSALSENWMRKQVKTILEIGLEDEAIKTQTKNGVVRYYYVDTW